MSLSLFSRVSGAAVCAVASAAFLALPALSAPMDEGDPTLDQTVADNEPVATEQTVIPSGHVDIGPRVIDGTWQILARDDSAAPVWRTLDSVALHVGDAAKMDVPTSEDYAFLGDLQGQSAWVIPQTQQVDVPWLGWNTQDSAALQRMNTGATMTIEKVEGPGHMWLFLQDGTFGAPRLLADSAAATDGKPAGEVWMEANTHVHANWVFSQPGVYLVHLRLTADDSAGGASSNSAQAVLRLAVGSQTDPHEAFNAVPAASSASGTTEDGSESASAAPSDSHGSSDAEHSDAIQVEQSSEHASSNTNWLFIGIIIVAICVAGTATWLLKAKRNQHHEALPADPSHAPSEEGINS